MALECGENIIPGIPQVGIGFGPDKKAAKTAAITMAQNLVSATAKALGAGLVCPPDCKNMNVQGVVGVKTKELANVRLAPALFISIVQISYNVRIDCRFAA